MINFLPPSAKKRYHLELARRLVIFYGMGMVVISAVCIGLLFSTKLYLDILRGAVLDSIEMFEETPQYELLRQAETKARAFNQQTETFLGLYEQIISTSRIFNDVYTRLPSGAYLNTISFDINAQKFSIGGFSATRNDILVFKKELEELKWVKTVDSPTSNILRETNSPFTFVISTNIKP